MLSYQHAYHAGNPADCIKHTLWGEVLAHMAAKSGPLWIAETHAGRGIYPVESPEMQKLQEYREGLGLVWPRRALISTAYMQAVKTLNPEGTLSLVPGSPYVALRSLRKGDELQLCEAHPRELTYLRRAISVSNVHIHKANGHDHIPAMVRGGTRVAVLIDPSYEVKTEYKQTVDTVKAILARNPQATIMVWAPVLPDGRQTVLEEGLAELGTSATWRATYLWNPLGAAGLTGTTQIILNLPYRMEDTLPETLGTMVHVLQASYPESRMETGFMIPRK
jgi:23S rRNA (adenine2030-N6)-methyltransferase